MTKYLDTKPALLRCLGLWSFYLRLTFYAAAMRTPVRELTMTLHF